MEKQKTGPKDVFMHLLSIIFLYAIVINFGILLFRFIDLYFPDILYNEYWRYYDVRRSLKWPLAILVIIFPSYVWLLSYLQKDLIKFPEKYEMKTRKWLLYFTLFAATITIIVDLIVLIFHYLDGELTTRFLLKITTVIIIAGATFTYYAWNLKYNLPPLKHKKMKLFVLSVIALAGASIIWGFIVSGSPQSERLRKFDETKINDLQNIQYKIIEYWQAKESLPPLLDLLEDDIYGWTQPTDPETKQFYDYSVTGDASFRLCANFNTANTEESLKSQPINGGPRYNAQNNWTHSEGFFCFNKTIDPDLFPSPPKIKY